MGYFVRRNYSGYQIKGTAKADKLPVDGLLVGKSSVVKVVETALSGFTKREVSIRVVKGYTYVYPLQEKKLTAIVTAIKTVIK